MAWCPNWVRVEKAFIKLEGGRICRCDLERQAYAFQRKTTSTPSGFKKKQKKTALRTIHKSGHLDRTSYLLRQTHENLRHLLQVRHLLVVVVIVVILDSLVGRGQSGFGLPKSNKKGPSEIRHRPFCSRGLFQPKINTRYIYIYICIYIYVYEKKEKNKNKKREKKGGKTQDP